MFGLIRMIFWIAVFGISIAVLSKYGSLDKKRNRLFLFIIITLLWTGSGLVPIENLFMSFSTPEKSYSYVNGEEVKLVVYGQESALVIGEESEFVYLVVPKGEKGWKIGRGLDLKFITTQYFDGVIVSVYQYKNTDEFYVEVMDIDGKECKVTDNQNSSFEILEIDVNGNKQYHYYAYVCGLNENYVLDVNNEKIILNNQ